jgi:hypothetical protein
MQLGQLEKLRQQRILSCFLELCYDLIRSIDFLTHIFNPIPFKGITIKISALILGKMSGVRKQEVTIRISNYLKDRL